MTKWFDIRQNNKVWDEQEKSYRVTPRHGSLKRDDNAFKNSAETIQKYNSGASIILILLASILKKRCIV